MGCETKETFADFGSMFKFLDSLSDAATMPIELMGFLPFSTMTNCDLSAQWKGLCKGRAAEVHTLPCTGCATESDLLATPNAHPCARWCTEHSTADPEWACYHKPMASPERVATMQAEVAVLVSTLERVLVEIDAESRITRFDAELDDPPEACFKDNMSVHYTPDTATHEQSYSRLLTKELILRGHDINGNLDARRERLRMALKDEATIRRLSKEIEHGNVKEGAYFLLMHMLPCVLHMENWNGIKILSMLLIEGISNAKKKLSYQQISGEGTRVLRFIADVEDLINRSILGTNTDPCQWMCPFDFKKRNLVQSQWTMSEPDGLLIRLMLWLTFASLMILGKQLGYKLLTTTELQWYCYARRRTLQTQKLHPTSLGLTSSFKYGFIYSRKRGLRTISI